MPLGYGLGLMYELIFKEPLENAHNSLADARAQAKVWAHPEVQKTFDKTQNVILMEDVWKGKHTKDAEHTQEITQSVLHNGPVHVN